jgi:hypothetical protein
MAAAAVSLACPLRRSTRLAHFRRPKYRPAPEPDNDHDSSSSDPENELTPRALRALKRQRLAPAPDAVPFPPRLRPRKRRKESQARRPTLPPPAHIGATPKPEPTSDPAGETQSIPRSPSPTLSPEPLTPLTPSPESSPSLPGHDRQALPPPMPEPSLPLDPALDTLIPFSQFDPELSSQIPPPPSLQALELQDQFPFPQHQLYVPQNQNPVFVRDREINIWKLACQERVDCLCVHLLAIPFDPFASR